MDKDSINKRFIQAVSTLFRDKGLTKAGIAESLGLKPSKFSEILNNRMRAGTDTIAALCDKYSFSPFWILMGQGTMLIPGELKGRSKPSIAIPISYIERLQKEQEASQTKSTDKLKAKALATIKESTSVKPIPLVTETAAAGFGNGLLSIEEKDVKEYYIIPKFRYCNVDFMIEVSGLSMYPHFNPGDVIACTILKDRKFLQWNKCHVIATREQGILVKRLMPSEQEGFLTAVSDNKEYPPFDIPVDEITGIALVVGSVGLE